MCDAPPGTIEIDDSSPAVRVRAVPPQEWFTLDQLRQYAAYLATVADEAEPSPELDKLTAILEVATLMSQSPRNAARSILAAGYELAERAQAPRAASEH